MSNKPMDREVWNVRERPLSSDNNQEATYADLALREVLYQLLRPRTGGTQQGDAPRSPQGFIGAGFKVRPKNPVSMNVTLEPGLGIQDDPTGLPILAVGGKIGVDDPHRSKWLSLVSAPTIPVPPNGGAGIRYDIVEVKWADYLTDQVTREIFDPVSEVFVATPNQPKTLSWNADARVASGAGAPPAGTSIYYKTGVAGSGVAPATDAGWIRIAQVQVDVGAVSIDHDRVTDERVPLVPGGVMDVVVSGLFNQNVGGPGTPGAILAPPGVEFAFWCDSTLTPSNHITPEFWIFPGATPAGAIVSGIGLGPVVLGGPEDVITQNEELHVSSVVTGNLTGADITHLNDAGGTGSPVKVAPGTPYVRVKVQWPAHALGAPADCPVVVLNINVKLFW